jgi:hypothetical protein
MYKMRLNNKTYRFHVNRSLFRTNTISWDSDQQYGNISYYDDSYKWGLIAEVYIVDIHHITSWD